MNNRKKITNPFYERIQRDGLFLKVDRQVTPGKKPRNPYYNKFKDEGICIIRPGRPKQGEIREPTKTRSIRLPIKIWALADEQAKAERLSTNAAIRMAILIWLKS